MNRLELKDYSDSVLTVKELKNILNKFDDSLPITLDISEENYLMMNIGDKKGIYIINYNKESDKIMIK